MDEYKESDQGKIKQDSDTFYSYVKIPNQYGIHARPATMIVKLYDRYDAEINLYNSDNDVLVSAKSIMSLMTLEANKNTIIRLDAKGNQAKPALEELIGLIQHGFGEE
jgi:phosphotransferase system HPr (HPr) family protein|tara:strand:- start:503 stop:826 length:324 start_codon:yes stop_codon:yes gene_type:complete